MRRLLQAVWWLLLFPTVASASCAGSDGIDFHDQESVYLYSVDATSLYTAPDVIQLTPARDLTGERFIGMNISICLELGAEVVHAVMLDVPSFGSLFAQAIAFGEDTLSYENDRIDGLVQLRYDRATDTLTVRAREHDFQVHEPMLRAWGTIESIYWIQCTETNERQCFDDGATRIILGPTTWNGTGVMVCHKERDICQLGWFLTSPGGEEVPYASIANAFLEPSNRWYEIAYLDGSFEYTQPHILSGVPHLRYDDGSIPSRVTTGGGALATVSE